MVDLDAFYAALKARLRVVVPQVLPASGGGGIVEAERAAMIPWLQVPVPYVAIVVPETSREPLTMDSLLYEAICDIYYVAEVAGDSGPVRGPLKDITSDLYPDDGDVVELDYGQVEDIASLPYYGQGLLPNQLFAKGNPLRRAGRLQLKVLLG